MNVLENILGIFRKYYIDEVIISFYETDYTYDITSVTAAGLIEFLLCIYDESDYIICSFDYKDGHVALMIRLYENESLLHFTTTMSNITD